MTTPEETEEWCKKYLINRQIWHLQTEIGEDRCNVTGLILGYKFSPVSVWTDEQKWMPVIHGDLYACYNNKTTDLDQCKQWPIAWVFPQDLKQLRPNTLNTRSSIYILQRVPHNNILDNGHGCLCVLHLGNNI